jgi:tetratricopeptide (TPR) repeat protein
MKRLFLLCVFCAVFSNSFACEDSYDPFFKTASFIGYQHSTYSRLLGIYQKPLATQPTDKDARKLSEQQEPANYAEYLKGAAQFDDGEYQEALKIFNELKSKQLSLNKKQYSWALEAATYMIARCQLVMAQNDWDGVGHPPEDVDQTLLKTAANSYQTYLKEYPKGLYANSAQGIFKMIYFLSGNQAELDRELKKAMLAAFPIAPTSNATYNIDMEEFGHHFHGQIDVAHDSPMLVAYGWLKNPKITPQDVSLLEMRKNDFTNYPGLFRYLHAFGLYQLGKYQELLDKVPEEPLVKSPIVLGVQDFRAQALVKLGKVDEAIAALNKMYVVSPEDAIELQMANIKISSGDGLWIFTQHAPINTKRNLRVFAQFGLTDSELEKGINSKEITGEKHLFLVDELARRYLLGSHFDKLSLLLAKESGTGVFTSIKPTSDVLAKNANDAQALVDMGEFIYQAYLKTSNITEKNILQSRAEQYSTDPSIDIVHPKLASVQEDGKSPLTFFRAAVIAAQGSAKQSEAAAKGLHYITLCSRYPEFRDRCTWGAAITKGSSKDAFDRLHNLYGNSQWAKKTPYFYKEEG